MAQDLSTYSDEDLRDELERRAGAQLCAYCGNVAKYLCDGLKYPEVGLFKSMDDVKTCDRPLCEDHRVKLGCSFDTEGPGTRDSIDFCPDCKAAYDGRMGPTYHGGGLRRRTRKAA